MKNAERFSDRPLGPHSEFPLDLPELIVVTDFLRTLRYGHDVTQASFAAARWGFSKNGTANRVSALSRWIDSVEKYFGQTFFRQERGKRSVLVDNRDTLLLIDHLCTTASEIKALFQGLQDLKIRVRHSVELQVGMYPSSASYLAPRLIQSWMSQQPKVRLSVHWSGVADSIERLRSGVYDLAIGDAMISVGEDVDGEELAYRCPPLGVVFPVSQSGPTASLTRLLKSKTISVERLRRAVAECPLILLSSPFRGYDEDGSLELCRTLAEWRGQEEGADQIVWMPTLQQCRLLVRANIGIGFGPSPDKPDPDLLPVKLPGAMVGYDSGHEETALGFLPAECFGVSAESCQVLAGKRFWLYWRSRGRGAPMTDKRADLIDALRGCIKKVCTGEAAGFSGLHYGQENGQTFLWHKFVD